MIVTSHTSFTDPALIEKLWAKGIENFIAYEVPLALAHAPDECRLFCGAGSLKMTSRERNYWRSYGGANVGTPENDRNTVTHTIFAGAKKLKKGTDESALI